MKKILFIAVIAALIVFSCSENSSKNNQPAQQNMEKKKEISGKEIYKTYCVACHGADGKMAFSGAKDLSVSTADLDSRISQITNGKGLMNAFKNILSEEEIRAVSIYVEDLRVE